MLRRALLTASLLLTIALLGACGSDSADTTSTTSPAVSTTAAPTTTQSTTSTTLPSTTTTVPTPATGELLVIGDWGSGTSPQGAVAGAMQRYSEDHSVSAVLTTGDNFYSDDAEFLMAPFAWVEAGGIDWWITWGNHDVETETRIAAIDEAFDDPPRWAVYDWGGIDVIVIDSNQIGSPAQAAFFLGAMAGSDRPAIVVMHHPPYSCSHEEATIDLVNDTVDLLDDDVVLVLSGHDHTFQRFEREGVSFVVTGGGGSELHPIQECPPNHPDLIVGFELHHFLALGRDEEGAIEVSAIDVNGDVFDTSVIELD